MRQTIVFAILNIIFFTAGAQYGCLLQEGDSCRVVRTGTELRTSPNYNYKVLATVGDSNQQIDAIVLQAKVVNGYGRIRVTGVKGDTTGISHLPGREAWVKKNYLECYASFPSRDLSDTSISWNEDIARATLFKNQKLCKYSAERHAEILLRRARARYREENYQGAVTDINTAIELLSNNDNLILYHWFRAHARSELGDYEGAIADFDYIIDHKDSLPAGSYDFDINEVLCWKAQSLYLSGDNFKAKSLLNIVIASDPEDGFAYYLRGQVRYFFEDKPGGCDDLNKAAELGFEEAFSELADKCD